MTVRRVDQNNDWSFGQGLANYVRRSEQVRQNVITRIKSFKRDWYLDTEAHIDWLNILGQKSNRKVILREVERVTLATDGVREITKLEITKLTDREAQIALEFTTVYDDQFQEFIGILNEA